MADFFRGLTGGFQTGLQFGQALRERQQREALAEAYGLTPQAQLAREATPAELSRAQAEAQALQQQDIAEFGLTPQEAQQYAPAMPTQGARVAMPTYRLGTQTFERAPTQEQIDSARMRAAADVYGQFGDAARREELMRGLRQEERAAAQEARSAAGFETQQRASQLQIEAAQRRAQEEQNITAARKRLTDLRKDGPLTAATIQRVSEESGLDPTQFLKAEDAVNTLEIKDTKRALSQAALKGEAGLNQFLADRFDPDKTDNITPRVTKDRQGNLVVMYGNQVLQEYGAHKNVMSLVGGVINMIDQNPFDTLKTLSTLEAQKAATEASRAAAGLSTARLNALTDQVAGTAEAARVRQQFMELSPEDQAGAKGQGLIKQFNMANAKAGNMVPLGTAPRATPELSPAVMKRYEELLKSDRWERARTIDQKIQLLENEGIAPASVGLRSPTDDIIAAMQRGPAAAQPAARRPQTATPAGQQLLGLANEFLPPQAPPPTVPMTSAERLRRLSLGQ